MTNGKLKIICVCGARPNFMKIAPIVDALRGRDDVETILVHTGQHYDRAMSQLFFEELGIPEPDVNLEVGSGSHAVQTGLIMQRFEPICMAHKPDWLIVVGDVNSTIACAMVAVKLGIKVAHVEAGLRSFDRTMPEEINRLLTDSISDLLFVSEPSGVENLCREGIANEKVHLVGNVMIDTLLRSKERASESNILDSLGVSSGGYVVVTLHRPSNVDDPNTFASILNALKIISDELPVVFPIHPRSRANLSTLDLDGVSKSTNFMMIDPLGYLDFLKLTMDASMVLTDSGGIQEETTILGVPCLTLRENTERPITLAEGTNRLTDCTTDAILQAYREIRASPPSGKTPALWDGHTAGRIIQILVGSS